MATKVFVHRIFLKKKNLQTFPKAQIQEITDNKPFDSTVHDIYLQEFDHKNIKIMRIPNVSQQAHQAYV